MFDLSSLAVDEAMLERALNAADLGSATRPTCDFYADIFGQLLKQTSELDDAYRLLGIVCGWRLRTDDIEAPLTPAITTANLSSPAVHDLTDSQLDVLAAIALRVGYPELRARLGDLVWIRARSHAHA